MSYAFFLCIKTYLTTEEPERLNQNQKNFTNYLLTFFLLAGTSLKTAKSFYYDERYYSFIRTEATKIQDPPDLVVSVPQIPQVGIFAQAGPSGMSRRPVQKSDNQSTETKKTDSDVSSPPQSPAETGVDKMTASDAETRWGSDSDVSSPPQSPTETGGSSAPHMEIPKVDPSTVAGPSEQPASLKKGMASESAENRFIYAAHGEAAAVETTPAAVQSELAVNIRTEYAGSSEPLSRFNSGGSDYSNPSSETERTVRETIGKKAFSFKIFPTDGHFLQSTTTFLFFFLQRNTIAIWSSKP